MEAGYRGAKAIRKDAVRWVEATVQLGRYHQESEEMQIEALKKREAYEELKEMYGEGISFPQVINMNETTPICVILCR